MCCDAFWPRVGGSKLRRVLFTLGEGCWVSRTVDMSVFDLVRLERIEKQDATRGGGTNDVVHARLVRWNAPFSACLLHIRLFWIPNKYHMHALNSGHVRPRNGSGIPGSRLHGFFNCLQ